MMNIELEERAKKQEDGKILPPAAPNQRASEEPLGAANAAAQRIG